MFVLASRAPGIPVPSPSFGSASISTRRMALIARMSEARSWRRGMHRDVVSSSGKKKTKDRAPPGTPGRKAPRFPLTSYSLAEWLSKSQGQITSNSSRMDTKYDFIFPFFVYLLIGFVAANVWPRGRSPSKYRGRLRTVEPCQNKLWAQWYVSIFIFFRLSLLIVSRSK
jgi:hypothetical protein